MAKSIKKIQSSPLFNLPVSGNTTEHLKELPKEQVKLLSEKLNTQLKEELNLVQQKIEETMQDQKDSLKKIFSQLDKIDYSKVSDQPLSTIISDTVSAQAEKLLKKEEQETLHTLITEHSGSNTVAGLLNLDLPADKNPLLLKESLKARMSAIAQTIGIKQNVIDTLLQKDISLAQLDKTSLEELEQQKLITAGQKNDLYNASRLDIMSGGDVTLVNAIMQKNIKSPVELIDWSKEDWLKVINDNKIVIPATEADAGSYAASLVEVVESSFPTDFYLNQVITKLPVTELNQLSRSLKPILDKNIRFLNEANMELDLGENDWQDIPVAEQKKIGKYLETVRPVMNTYKQLGLAAILNNAKIPAAEKEKEITGRLSALDLFYNNNPDLDIFSSDFSTNLSSGKKPVQNWEGIDEKIRPYIQKQMAAFQRSYIIGGVEKTAKQLLSGGFDSALSIVAFTEEDFIQKAGLDYEEGRKIYHKAGDVALGAAHYFGSIKDGIRGTFDKLKVSNQYPLTNDLKEIDGFEQLFGNQDYCDCCHCRSVLSPAAYFSDLMYFAQEYVSKKAFTGANANHPLYLKRRRPDLWKLKLTCENTNKEIPYLQVVTEVLASYLESELAIADVYTHLKTADRSVSQPFDLGLESLRVYLGHFGMGLQEVYTILEADKKDLHREQLKLSPEQLRIIITKDVAGVKKRFGNKTLSNFNVQEFITYAQISRKEIDELLATTFIAEISKVKIKTIKDSSDIQKYSEQLDQLNDERLDYIHRYLRLWKQTPWTLAEFDLVLNALKQKGLLNNLEESNSGYAQVLQLGVLLSLQNRLAITVEELAALVFQLPEIALKENQKSFASRIFDLAQITGNIPAANKIPRILSGLGISETELQSLVQFLGLDLAQAVTIPVLSSLYRHARIARGLKIKIEELITAAQLILNGQAINTLNDISAMIDFATWVKAAPYSIAELNFICSGNTHNSVQYKYTPEQIMRKIWEIQQQEAVINAADAAEKLSLMQTSLRDFILNSYNLTAAQLDDQFLAVLISDNLDVAGKTALQATFTNEVANQPADFDALISLLRKVERYQYLFNLQGLSAAQTGFILAQPAVLGISDLQHIGIADIRAIDMYNSFIRQNPDAASLLETALSGFQANGNFNAQEQNLATFLDQPERLLHSVLAHTSLPTTAISALKKLGEILQLCSTMGIQGESLAVLAAPDFAAASTVALAAFSAKYPDEDTRLSKLETYTDKLNTLKRDALCDYIISREDKFKFKDLNDLYAFFLLDVEMGGCYRTSYVVAAVTSLQLYIMRCLTNLEQSDPLLNPAVPDIRVLPTWIPSDEWDWRKNYRVWEANRKVFLYPENYIEPALRDTKTQLFKDLEDELLQQKITKDSAETAYKKYMAQFTELTRMRYAGAYYHSVKDNYGFANIGSGPNSMYYFIGSVYYPLESDESCYYLFARTNVLPYQYHYRTYNHQKKIWGNWNKIELSIEAKEISTLIHQGKLYIFWTEVKNKEINKVSNGTSSATDIAFTAYVKYAFLTENGKWSAPQRLSIGQDTISKQKVYGRGKGTTSFDDATWEKEKDAIIEAFQEKVFRKPYAYRQADKTVPVGLGFIWSNDKGGSNVTYTVGGASYLYDCNLFKLSFFVPSASFQIINNDFSAATKTVSINVSIKINSAQVSQTIQAQLQLKPGGICLFRSELLGIAINFSMGASVSGNNTAIKEGNYNLSLSRNTITNPVVNIFSNGGNLNSYYNEYYAAYSEDGSLCQFIENGTRAMTDDKIKQDIDGTGGIHIYNNQNEEFIPAHTILTDELSDILYAKGVEEFLSLKTQLINDDNGQQLDFRGAYGEYYWEIFFHIPFLIANHFNANQKFAEAKWWYERIFNPTSDETPSPTHPTDHNWQFCEFRGLSPQKLKDILTDVKAIEAYKKDPFDPHAIARLRISSYQKAIVMKYIDNLLDWGDYLFTQDTRESINEAEMLYRLALNILGDRPVKMGKCDTENEEQLSYEKIAGAMSGSSDFLITLENVFVQRKQVYEVGVGAMRGSKGLAALYGKDGKRPGFDAISASAAVKRLQDLEKYIPKNALIPVKNSREEIRNTRLEFVQNYTNQSRKKAMDKAASRDMKGGKLSSGKAQMEKMMGVRDIKFSKIKRFPSYELVKQISMVFCVPENHDLLQYWDRTEDRLYKIWNCMNIKGIRRSLSLFQPPIDPMMLVRMKAAGLSMEDILALIAGAQKTPLYRFSYLLEKARQFTQVVQGFGSALLSALEKKDTEELLLLRTTHEKNILRLSREIKKEQVKEAKNQYQSAIEGQTNVQNRMEYYQGLIDTGLIPWEVAEQISKWTAGGLRITEATLGFLSSVFGFLPQIGSPFAMKYGGQELKNGTDGLHYATGTLAAIADNVAILAGMEAGHMRREQEWKQQLKTAQQEYKQVSESVLAAEVRQLITEKDLAMHEQSMEQLDELDDFYKNKFTGIGLYNYMASGLSRIYRTAYNMAYELAKQAEAAYQFERFSSNIYILNDNWQADKAGLLAGDQLLQQLMSLEKQYMDTNERKPEIMQSFSLALLDVSQLIQLRQTGSCTIKIPELAFDMYYPGHYRRVIKSLRLSIPCVAGPYTNISARLTLLKGEIREQEGEAIREIAIAKNTSISASNAQNDAGVFELHFNDERYLPFEGAGAISEWRIELPSAIRAFNYDTIPDVIMHLSYTALDGDRAAAESSLQQALEDYATDNGLYRMFSMRHEFAAAFQQLMASPTQATEFKIEEAHFPYFIQNKTPDITEVQILLKPTKGHNITLPTAFTLNTQQVTWDSNLDVTLPGAANGTGTIKGASLSLSGSPFMKWAIAAAGLNMEDTEDILVLVKYSV